MRRRRFPRAPRIQVAAQIAGATGSATSQRSNGNAAKDPNDDLRYFQQHRWILVGSIRTFRTLNTRHFQHLDGRHIETLLLQGLGKSLRDIARRIGQGGHFGKHLCHSSCGRNHLITNPHRRRCRHRSLHSQPAQHFNHHVAQPGRINLESQGQGFGHQRHQVIRLPVDLELQTTGGFDHHLKGRGCFTQC